MRLFCLIPARSANVCAMDVYGTSYNVHIEAAYKRNRGVLLNCKSKLGS